MKVESWLESIGKTHAVLVELGLDPDLRLVRLYPGATELYLEPEAGLSYRFYAKTKVLNAVIVSIVKRVESQPEFKGTLSQPYGCLTKNAVREVWGNPLNAKGPSMMPQPIGKTGGWDLYELTSQGFDNLELVFQYTSELSVSGVVLRARDDEA
ncbi:hypothetical protein [Pseudomonas sp. Teo4]|uniref:hypothetical protein n=1 Tax=Pseudomonas sp. Teo4 TaxID=3064528 RepID=UPI002ACB0D99|nr:hypothetical protein [Pseudomonas sp. Teo4]